MLCNVKDCIRQHSLSRGGCGSRNLLVLLLRGKLVLHGAMDGHRLSWKPNLALSPCVPESQRGEASQLLTAQGGGVRRILVMLACGCVSSPMLQVALRDWQVVFVLGGPGSGKSTQCEKLVTKYGCLHLTAVDLLRQEVSANTAKGREIAETIKEGKIVPVQAGPSTSNLSPITRIHLCMGPSFRLPAKRCLLPLLPFVLQISRTRTHAAICYRATAA